MNNKLIFGAVIVLLVAGGIYFATKSSYPPEAVPANPVETADTTNTGVKETGPSTEVEKKETTGSGALEKGDVKSFSVEGSSFSFSLKEMRVKKGDTVKIVFTNKEGFHDWVIDEFSARTKQIKAGASETVQFVADKTGTFEYYCSVGQHRAQGMKGNLIVE